MITVLPALAALLVAAGSDRPETVNVLYPKTVYGASRLIALERLAARYEQASGAAELSLSAIESDGNDADLIARCDGFAVRQVLFINPTTLTVISSPARLQLSVQATLVRCADKRIASSSRTADVAGILLEDPSVLRGYKALEASVIRDLLCRLICGEHSCAERACDGECTPGVKAAIAKVFPYAVSVYSAAIITATDTMRRSFRMRRSTEPTRVSQSRSRYPFGYCCDRMIAPRTRRRCAARP